MPIIKLSGPQKFSHLKQWASEDPTLRTTDLKYLDKFNTDLSSRDFGLVACVKDLPVLHLELDVLVVGNGPSYALVDVQVRGNSQVSVENDIENLK